MKTYLVIVESPGKIKKLKAILGAEYEIIASMGHVVDLPRKSFGINLETIKPEYDILKADVAKTQALLKRMTFDTMTPSRERRVFVHPKAIAYLSYDAPVI